MNKLTSPSAHTVRGRAFVLVRRDSVAFPFPIGHDNGANSLVESGVRLLNKGLIIGRGHNRRCPFRYGLADDDAR